MIRVWKWGYFMLWNIAQYKTQVFIETLKQQEYFM